MNQEIINYFNVPKMNYKWIQKMSLPYLSQPFRLTKFQVHQYNDQQPITLTYSLHHFIKEEEIHKLLPKYDTSISIESIIEKEWKRLNQQLIRMHILFRTIDIPSSLFQTDNVWNSLHCSAFPLTELNPNIWNYHLEKMANVLFLNPQSSYVQNYPPVFFIFSLFDLNDEQFLYLVLLSILLQSSKGYFAIKVKLPFSTIAIDVFLLLSSLYNKVVFLPLDSQSVYVVCKGFQSDFIKNNIPLIKNALFAIRPYYHLSAIHSSLHQPSKATSTPVVIHPFTRIFSENVPVFFLSKIEEIQVLMGHRQFHQN